MVTANIALQGGGAHGAFSWGVLDRLLEEKRLEIPAISGTSAGAMNAAVLATGLARGGKEEARRSLATFWREVASTAKGSPMRRTGFDLIFGGWSLDLNPGYIMADLMSRVFSPYDFNPLDINPLRELVKESVDFDAIHHSGGPLIFISATNVETGKVRVFEREELTLDAVMASACLPHLFKAVEIDGVPYWDGGYMGNPMLTPFIDKSPCADILVVQINPLERPGTPRTARDILNRANEITFNASLLREMRLIATINQLISDGRLDDLPFREVRFHMIDGGQEMLRLSASSKMNAERDFLEHLFETGRSAADRWISQSFSSLGRQSTLNIGSLLGEFLPRFQGAEE